MRANYADQNQEQTNGVEEPSVRNFLKTVKANLGNVMLSEAQSKAVLKNAQMIENGLLDWVGGTEKSNEQKDSARRLHMDYLLHHRLELAKEIAISFASGNNLSQRRRKVLENSINYLEENLG